MTNQLRLRAVFDTNVIIAALRSSNPTSPTAELLRRWEVGEFDLVYSNELKAEYERKFPDRRVEPGRAETFLRQLERSGIHVEPMIVEAVVQADEKDNMVVACAISGDATHLVTYDADLHGLGEAYRGIRIVDGLHFLYHVRGDTPPS
ncbi:MAG: putative toxin-antitoxin system toxin component, PIN family [Anaerolineae bacterium]|nr:putative toxin-antitoxin system toxin component, PIN family [Anaerolineae bacterium]